MAGPAAAELRLICPVSQTWPYLLGHIFLASHLTRELLRNNWLAWSTSSHAWISNLSPSSPVASPEAKLWLVTYPHQQGHQPIHRLSSWPLILLRADDPIMFSSRLWIAWNATYLSLLYTLRSEEDNVSSYPSLDKWQHFRPTVTDGSAR